MAVCMLTTKDNPYNYFKNFDEWLAYDRLTGSRAISTIGRFARTSPELSFAEYTKEIERAVDEIIKYDSLNVFDKVVRQDSNK